MRTLRSLLRMVFIWAVALTISITVHVQQPEARHVVRDLLNLLVSNAILGNLEIGRISWIGGLNLIAHDVTLQDAQGRDTIFAKRIRLSVQPYLPGQRFLVFNDATINGGVLYLHPLGEEGLPSLIEALTPEPADPDATDPLLTRLLARALPDAALVERIEFRNMAVRGALLGLEGIAADRVEGNLRIDVDRELNIVLRNTRGRLTAPFPFTAELSDVFAHFSSREQKLVEVHANATSAKERAHVDLYFGLGRKDEPQLDIQLASPQISAATVTGLGFEFMSLVSTDLSGELRLQGDPAALTLDGQFDSRAGVVTVGGQLGHNHAVQIESGGLYLGDALAAGPPVTVAGRVELALPDTEEGPIEVIANLEPTRVLGLLLPSATVIGLLTDEAFELRRLTAKTPGARLRSEGRIVFDAASRLHVSAHFDDIRRDPRLRKLLPNAAGELDADLTVHIADESEEHRTRIVGTLKAKQLTYGDLSADRLSLDVAMSGDLSRPALKLVAQGERLRYSGYFLGDGRARLYGGPKRYQLSGALGRDGAYQMGLDGAVAVGKRGFIVNADRLELLVGDESFRGSVKDLEVVNGQSVHIGELLLASRSQRLQAGGTIRNRGEDTFLAELQDFDLTALSTVLGQKVPVDAGRADALLQITGDVQSPRLLLQGALRGGRIYGVDQIQAVYMLQYADGKADIDGELQLGRGGVIRVLGDGTLDNPLKGLQPSLLAAAYDIQVDVADVELAQVPQLSPQVSAGRLETSVNLKGTVERPRLRGDFKLRELIAQEAGPFAIDTDFRYDGENLHARVTARDGHGPLGQATLDAAMEYGRIKVRPVREVLASGPFVLNGHTAERRTDQLPFDILSNLPFPMKGNANFELRKQQGPLVGYAWFEADPAEVVGDDEECDLADHSPHLRGSLSLGQERLHFDSALTLGKAQVVELKGSLRTPLSDLLHRGADFSLSDMKADANFSVPQIEHVPFLCSLGAGDLRGSLQITDALSTSPRVEGKLISNFFPREKHQTSRKRVAIRSCETEPVTLNLEVRSDHERAALTGYAGGCGGGTARTSIFLPVEWRPEMAWPSWDQSEPFQANLKLDRTQLKPLLDRIPGVLSGAGFATGSLRVEGLPAKPDYLGTITVSEGDVVLAGTGQRVEDISTKLRFREQRGEIQRASARSEDGRLGVKGYVHMEGLLPRHVQLVVQLAGFPIRQEGHRLASLSGSGALETDIGEGRARTAVVLSNLAVRLPDEPPQSLQPLQAHPDISIVEETDRPPPEQPYPLEFQVTAETPLLVQRNDFEAEVRPSLAVYYADPELRIGGFLEFQRGSFEVFGKDFDIMRGNMRFDGGSGFNPEVNLTAVHRLSATRDTVTVQASGYLSAPNIRFQSETCPGQSGALTLLLTNRCADDPGSASDSRATEGAFAAGLLQGVLTLGARQELGGLIPNLAVESGQQGYATRVRAGIESRELVPEFMRSFIQKVYIQGAVSAAQTDSSDVVRDTAPLDFLIELYFPKDIVGSGHFAPDRWGLDVTWQP